MLVSSDLGGMHALHYYFNGLENISEAKWLISEVGNLLPKTEAGSNIICEIFYNQFNLKTYRIKLTRDILPCLSYKGSTSVEVKFKNMSLDGDEIHFFNGEIINMWARWRSSTCMG